MDEPVQQGYRGVILVVLAILTPQEWHSHLHPRARVSIAALRPAAMKLLPLPWMLMRLEKRLQARKGVHAREPSKGLCCKMTILLHSPGRPVWALNHQNFFSFGK